MIVHTAGHENRTRRRIRRRVRERPGIHFNDLTRALDLAPGQVQHHVRRLLDDGALVRSHLYGRTHYYPPTFDDWERGALALFRRETARAILLFLLENGDARPAAVADAIGVARSTLEWHLDHLVEQGVVEKRRDARNRVTLTIARPVRTNRLLATVEPSLPDRLVDRFVQFVDRIGDDPDDDR